jgi:hypothetical protein
VGASCFLRGKHPQGHPDRNRQQRRIAMADPNLGEILQTALDAQPKDTRDQIIEIQDKIISNHDRQHKAIAQMMGLIQDHLKELGTHARRYELELAAKRFDAIMDITYDIKSLWD